MTTHASVRAPLLAEPLVITDDPQLLDHIHACAAVVGSQPQQVEHAPEIGRGWSSSSVVLVGLDRAQAVAEMLLPRRAQVVLLGHDGDAEALCRWSQPLAATTLSLPGGISWLTSLLGEESRPTAGGRLLAVAGASGGLGTSTLAVGLAQRAAGHSKPDRSATGQPDHHVAVVDGDPGSGGLDLLLGIESVAGRRWRHFAGAHGRLPGVLSDLPGRDRVKVLAADQHSPEIKPSAMSAVLRAATEESAATIVDIGRSSSESSQAAVRLAAEVWLVVGNDIASVAAARRARQRLASMAEVRLLVRRLPWGELTRDQVAELTDLEPLVTLPHDRRIALGVDQGLGPAAASGRRWLKAVDELATRWVRP